MNIFTYLTPKNNTYYIIDNISVRQAIEKFDFYKFSVVPVIDENGNNHGVVPTSQAMMKMVNILIVFQKATYFVLLKIIIQLV